MTDKAVADKPRRMGRPPLKQNIKTKATMVRLTEDVRLRIETLVGERRMAAFIREAIEAELKRRERQKPEK
ncbi:hypothetical protein [Xanthobacter tagetidis]|uniref:hypothetical protein n=1 Tax=Xanthobacter tagetidis TaxID=60216 RepID=UPI0011C48811|nr:hypothetical protein [Xanthobacter tagetidis]MBB6306280.1 hypothetical protein [Xanthobacter tagetidis]